MLVLSRKNQERVILRDQATGIEITVQVVDMRPGKIRLGFTAPQSVAIYREEIAPENLDGKKAS